MRAGASGSSPAGGAPTTRQPPQKTCTSLTPAGSSDAENARGSSRTGAPSPSHTPFDPLLTSAPV